MDKWMNNNNFNKILALALSIILWAMVHIDTASTTQTTATMESRIIENVPIVTTGLDEDKYILESMDADSVRLEVMGRSNDLNYHFSDSYKVTLDLSNVEPGTTAVPLKYTLPRGVELISITPQEVHVHIEERSAKSFPVTVIPQGEPAEGFQVGTPVSDPATVEVTLPASELANVARVQGTVEVGGESETISKKLKLTAYDASGNEIKDAVIEPSSVSVEVPITLPFKSVPLRIGYTGSLPDSLVLSKVTPDVDTVTVYGQETALESITSCQAVLDLSSIKSAGTTTLKLNLTPPEGAEDIDPGSLDVTVVASQVAERTISDVPVTVEGVSGDLSASVTSPSGKMVSLTVTGASSLLDQLEKGDIKAVADVSGLGAGDHVVPVTISLPNFIELAGGSTPQVTVHLSGKAASASPAASPASGPAVTPEPSSKPASGAAGDEPQPSEGTQDPAGPAPTVSPQSNSVGEAVGDGGPVVQ